MVQQHHLNKNNMAVTKNTKADGSKWKNPEVSGWGHRAYTIF